MAFAPVGDGVRRQELVCTPGFMSIHQGSWVYTNPVITGVSGARMMIALASPIFNYSFWSNWNSTWAYLSIYFNRFSQGLSRLQFFVLEQIIHISICCEILSGKATMKEILKFSLIIFHVDRHCIPTKVGISNDLSLYLMGLPLMTHSAWKLHKPYHRHNHS